jgi:hypothetical protein
MVAANEDVIHMRRKNKVVGTTPAANVRWRNEGE